MCFAAAPRLKLDPRQRASPQFALDNFAYLKRRFDNIVVVSCTSLFVCVSAIFASSCFWSSPFIDCYFINFRPAENEIGDIKRDRQRRLYAIIVTTQFQSIFNCSFFSLAFWLNKNQPVTLWNDRPTIVRYLCNLINEINNVLTRLVDGPVKKRLTNLFDWSIGWPVNFIN
jgi:hypothetical protein